MKFDLTTVIHSLDNQPLTRRALSDKFDDTPLTAGFVIANVLSVAVEDLAALDQRAMAPQTSDEDRASLRLKSYEAKLQRGNLARRISYAERDGHQVELSASELVVIQSVIGPRLMPLMLAQVNDIIN